MLQLFRKKGVTTPFTPAKMPEVDPATPLNIQINLAEAVSVYNMHYPQLINTESGKATLKAVSDGIKRVEQVAQYKDRD